MDADPQDEQMPKPTEDDRPWEPDGAPVRSPGLGLPMDMPVPPRGDWHVDPDAAATEPSGPVTYPEPLGSASYPEPAEPVTELASEPGAEPDEDTVAAVDQVGDLAHQPAAPQMPRAPEMPQVSQSPASSLRFPSPYDTEPGEDDPEPAVVTEVLAEVPGDLPDDAGFGLPVPLASALDDPDDPTGVICPYLLSEDGTWRSTQPDPRHRCTAQDPPGTLPSAFQERFCLTERHDRCEMYKYAQTTHAAILEPAGDVAGQAQEARSKPSVRSLSLGLRPSGEAAVQGGPGLLESHRNWVVAAGISGVVMLVVVVVLIFGGGGSGDGSVPGPGDSPGAAGNLTAQPASTPAQTPTDGPGATVPNGQGEPVVTASEVLYEVQEGEALARIAETFGTTRRAILRANEGMADKTPFVVPGDQIIVPISADLSAVEISAVPGFLEFIEGS